MREQQRNLIVGIFVLIGLFTLIVLIMMFEEVPAVSTGKGFTLKVRFDRATGIRPGTQATVGGIPVGRVWDVGFADPSTFEGGVIVEIVFDHRVRLHRGTRAETVEPGLGMGRPPIRIIPGPRDQPLLADGAEIPGTISSAVAQIIPPDVVSVLQKSAAQIGLAAEALTPVLNDLHQLLEPRPTDGVDRPGGTMANLSTAVARLDKTLRHFNEVLGDPTVKSNLRETVANMHRITEDGKVMVADLRAAAAEARTVTTQARELTGQVQSTVAKLDRRVDEVAEAILENMDLASGLLTHMSQAAAQVNQGQGTLGHLVSDPRLYESMVLTFRRLADATEELRLLLQEWQKGKIRVSAW